MTKKVTKSRIKKRDKKPPKELFVVTKNNTWLCPKYSIHISKSAAITANIRCDKDPCNDACKRSAPIRYILATHNNHPITT